MAVGAWLLLGLMTVQTAAGRDLYNRRDIEDAEDTPISESDDWIRFIRDDRTLDSELEDWKSSVVRTAANVTAGNCGQPAIAPNVMTRVTGGIEAVPHSWPWMISIEVDGQHNCGGSLINNQWIVSAGHCGWGYHKNLEQLAVVVGQHRRSQPDRFTVRVPVGKIFVSPKYQRAGFSRVSNDIMLLKLAHPVQFNDAVSTVCLQSPFQVLPAGKRCFSSGWGWLSTSADTPDDLQQVMVPLIDNQVCNQPAWYNGALDDSMTCAGYAEGQRGNCKGDSGGPLVCHDGERWVLYGAVSWGRQVCAVRNHPGVYARVSPHISWIEETINANSD